jgi:SAM-dependent methyltransferase
MDGLVGHRRRFSFGPRACVNGRTEEVRGAGRTKHTIRPMGRERQRWEVLWQRRSGPELEFYQPEPPEQLHRLLADVPLPPGGALDVGCGSGVVTAFLARSFVPTVGIDVSHSALRRARGRAGDEKTAFVVAEAPVLPFRAERFALVFDRGCMHNIPPPAWPLYLQESERVLVPGGVHQLLFANLDRPPRRRWRRRLRRLRAGVAHRLGLGGRGHLLTSRPHEKLPLLTDELLASLLPPSFEMLRLERFPYTTPRGRRLVFTHCVSRKQAMHRGLDGRQGAPPPMPK